MIKFLLTSSGISNTSIRNALVSLLGKPIEECSALFIPTAISPYPQGPFMVYDAIAGKHSSKLAQLGWKSLGILELATLPGIDKEVWVQSVAAADALLVWGGDPVYLAHWMRHSGLIDVLATLNKDLVYVGVSAGSMAATSIIGETYRNLPAGNNSNALASESIIFTTPQGELNATFVKARGAGFVDFSIIPHFDNVNHLDACGGNVEKWAAKIPAQVYAIDDQSAIKVVEGEIEVVSEGKWKLYNQP
jgi:dipeptidase E